MLLDAAEVGRPVTAKRVFHIKSPTPLQLVAWAHRRDFKLEVRRIILGARIGAISI